MRLASGQWLLVSLMFAAAVQAATPAPPLPHVRFFAEGIDTPLGTIYEALALARECRRQYPRECGESIRMAAKGGPLDIDPALTDLGSLFAATLSSSRAPAFNSTNGAKEQMGRLLARMQREGRDYDRQVYARAAAVYNACSDTPGDLGMLISIYHVDDLRFHGESQATYERDLKVLGKESDRLQKLIADQWPKSSCRKALELARQLMGAMHRKVEIVFVDNWRTPELSQRHSPVATHIWETAYLLAREHEPAVGARVEEYERKRAAEKARD